MSENLYKIKGKVQHYAWGGYSFISNFLNEPNIDHKPCAEYWLGAHPSASSTVIENNDTTSLLNIIKQNPVEMLTGKVFDTFGELPFLFKVLDVKDMLSIQVHPTKAEAEKGFAAEEAEGISITASNRNYKDRNHKPEIMIALSEFWLLHGFKSLAAIKATLQQVKQFETLMPAFEKGGIKGLMEYVYNLPTTAADDILLPLLKEELIKKQAGHLTKNDAGWWAIKLFEDANFNELQQIDKGIFSIYFFNIVKADIGEAVFQAAGVPHAYLEGQNIELMANSDNVLRGGLTPKHVDVPELLKHTLFEPVVPNMLKGNLINKYEKVFECPVPDFNISVINITDNQPYLTNSQTPQILLCYSGNCTIKSGVQQVQLMQGESCFVLPHKNYTVCANNETVIYKAFC